MNILVDENIPYALEAFGSLGNVKTISGRAINRDRLLDIDALIVRSITTVDRRLLSGTPVRFVGTATNGIDHIDTEYLGSAGIAFAHAGGSNATSVAEYVLAAILDLRARGKIAVEGQRVGIIGVGEVGGRLSNALRALGMDVVEYDPVREKRDSLFRSARYEEIFECDIVSLHVPLTVDGTHPTEKMVGEAFLLLMQQGSVLINTSRGGVVDSAALFDALDSRRLSAAVLDVWEGEPAVPPELVGHCALATPHIAGYTLDAKVRGTEMMASALADFLGVQRVWSAANVLPERVATIEIPATLSPLDAVSLAVGIAYDIDRDDSNLRELLTLDEAARRDGFDRLRKNYPVRREFSAYGVPGAGQGEQLLALLGFTLT